MGRNYGVDKTGPGVRAGLMRSGGVRGVWLSAFGRCFWLAPLWWRY